MTPTITPDEFWKFVEIKKDGIVEIDNETNYYWENDRKK